HCEYHVEAQCFDLFLLVGATDENTLIDMVPNPGHGDFDQGPAFDRGHDFVVFETRAGSGSDDDHGPGHHREATFGWWQVSISSSRGVVGTVRSNPDGVRR